MGEHELDGRRPLKALVTELFGDPHEEMERHLYTIFFAKVLGVDLASFFGSRPLDRIGRGEVEALAARMARRGSSPKSIRNARGVLHRIFEYARRQEWIEANPVSLVDKCELRLVFLPAVRLVLGVLFALLVLLGVLGGRLGGFAG
jgi:hypothetical protein